MVFHVDTELKEKVDTSIGTDSGPLFAKSIKDTLANNPLTNDPEEVQVTWTKPIHLVYHLLVVDGEIFASPEPLLI